mgnify:CR=1 FL=1
MSEIPNLVSVVVPVYYGAETITPLVERLLAVVANSAMTAPQAQPFGQHVSKPFFVIDN